MPLGEESGGDDPFDKVLQEAIDSDDVVMFSAKRCPYCDMAKNQLNGIKQKFTTIELDTRPDADQMIAALAKRTGAMTVPQIFVKGKNIGGAQEMSKLLYGGQLQKLLKEK